MTKLAGVTRNGGKTANDGIADSVLSILDNGGTEPATEPATKPAAEPATEPAAEPAAEPGSKAKSEEGPFAGVPDSVLGIKDKKTGPVKSSEPPDPDDDDEEPPEIKGSQKAKNSWQRIKQEKRELQDKLAQMQKDLEAARGAKPPEMEQFVAMQKKLEEYENRIGQLDITQSSAFRQKYEVPLEVARRKGLSVLLRAGVEREPAEELIGRLLGSDVEMQEIEGLIADQPIAVQGALFSVASEYSEAAERREAAIKDWRNEQAALKASDDVEKDIVLARNVEAETSSAVQKALEAGNWLFAEVPDNPEWNKSVQERVRAVKGIMRSASRADLANWVVEGVTARIARDLFVRARKEYDELKSQFESVVGRTPALRGDAPSQPARSGVTPKAGLAPEELFDELFSGAPGGPTPRKT